MGLQLMMPVNDTNAYISVGKGEGEGATRADGYAIKAACWTQ
jgi:hypothetical protein